MGLPISLPQSPDAPPPGTRKGWLEGLAVRLNERLASAAPEDIVAAGLASVAPGRFAVVSSFGAESAVLLHAVAQVARSTPILLLDTGYLFRETLAYRDTLIARLGLTDVRSLPPSPAETAAEDPEGALYLDDPNACCALRKVRPLARELARFDAWANGRKRFQAATRAHIPIVESDGLRLKFNPLAGLSAAALADYAVAADLPPHPLLKYDYASIGCMPCTSRVAPGEDARSGRWRGRTKVECGIHLAFDAAGGETSDSATSRS